MKKRTFWAHMGNYGHKFSLFNVTIDTFSERVLAINEEMSYDVQMKVKFHKFINCKSR